MDGMTTNARQQVGEQVEQALEDEEVQALYLEIATALHAAGGAIVKHHEEQGLGADGVGWLLAQACLRAGVGAYLAEGRSLDELLAQVSQAWNALAAASVGTPQGPGST